MRYCDISEDLLQCKTCGARFRSSQILSHCIGTRRDGLGDRVASALDAVGITKERVEALVGGPCGCQERQAKMNAAGAKWLGLPPGSTAGDVDPPT